MKLKELIQKIAAARRIGLDHEESPFPDNLESFLDEFIPNQLLKSETLQKAFGVSPYEMEELYREAYGYYDADNYRESATSFRWLVLLNPFKAKYWMGLAATQKMEKYYEKALHGFAMAALLDSENPFPHFHAYECYAASNNKEDAEKALILAYQRAKGKAAYVELVEQIKRLS